MTRLRRALHHAYRLLIKWARTLHVYSTLFGFVLLLFFAVTGFMLNHEDWFNPDDTSHFTLPTDKLSKPTGEPWSTNEEAEELVQALADFGVSGKVESFTHDDDVYRLVLKSTDREKGKAIQVNFTTVVIQRKDGRAEATRDRSGAVERIMEGKMPMNLIEPWDEAKKLAVVEKLRKDFALRGDLKAFDPPTESDSFFIQFMAPGYTGIVTIEKKDGQTKVKHQSRGINGILLDLHRGKESGEDWKLVIDGVAILFVIVSITGLLLWTSLRARARHGWLVILLGTGVGLWFYYAYVPR